MRGIALVLIILGGWITSAFAQAAEIDAVNAAWMSVFEKGDFAGIAALYTEDAAVLPPVLKCLPSLLIIRRASA